MLETAVREARATTLRIPVDRWLAAGTVASFLGLLLTDRVPPGVTTARHALSVDERYLVVSGKGRVEVEGLEPEDISPGDVVLIPAGKVQRIRNPGPDDLVFLCICTPRFEPRHYRDREASP